MISASAARNGASPTEEGPGCFCGSFLLLLQHAALYSRGGEGAVAVEEGAVDLLDVGDEFPTALCEHLFRDV